jgi:hypothetical protein
MAPPGIKVIMYKDSNTHTSWASYGLDAWLLGPSKDHYRCHLITSWNQQLLGFRFSQPLPPILHCTALLAGDTSSSISSVAQRIVTKCDKTGTNAFGTMHLGAAP